MIAYLKKYHFFPLLMVLNCLAVLYHASLYLFVTKYITQNGRSHFLLEKLPVVPNQPNLVFFMAIGLFATLLSLIFSRNRLLDRHPILITYVFLVELILLVGTFVALQYSYNGLFLFVFLDIFYSTTDLFLLHKKRHWLLLLVLSFGALLLSNEEVLSLVVKLPLLDVYLDFLPQGPRFLTLLIEKTLSSFNIVLFIISLVSYVIHVISKQEKIEKELGLAAQVNQELNNYVAITEKVVEDRERKRISREIHDTLGHALTGISAGIDAIKVLIDLDSDRAKQQLDNISLVVRDGLHDVRRSIEKLRPGALDGRRLEDALKKMISDYQAISRLVIDLDYCWGDIDLEMTKEDIIFRVIQESITNSLRHGHAKSIKITMTKGHVYDLVIKDDGCGVSDLIVGYGLVQMQERLAIIGGSVIFDGSDGFTTHVKIPMMKGEEE